MRTHFIPLCAGLISLALLGATARADQAAAEKQIKDLSADFAKAWNQHDDKAVAAFWAEDGDLIDPAQKELKGRTEIEHYFTDCFAGVFKDTTLDVVVTKVRLAADDVAIADWEATVSGMKGPDGQAGPPVKHHVVLVLKNQGGKWMMLAARPYVLPQAPGSMPMPGPMPEPMPDAGK